MRSYQYNSFLKSTEPKSLPTFSQLFFYVIRFENFCHIKGDLVMVVTLG
jgi:hypothetical protein